MLKEKLQGIKNASQTTDLYAHLSNVLTKILLDNPLNAYELFEDYSNQVRQSGFDFTKHQEFDVASRLNVNYDSIEVVSEKTKKLIGKINIGTVEEPLEAGPCGYVPNMLEESKWFEWAGVGFGTEETYKLFKSLTLLSVSKQVKQVRLWGKIIGTQRDYYVAEGQVDSTADDGELPPNVEARGTGINKLTYWVTNDILLGEWTELPLLHPHHIEVARKIRYIFTGNLEAKVVSNPFFFGAEKLLLKAQIVRISHSTAIVPKGMYTVQEDDLREVGPTDEYKLPGFDVLKQMSCWVHLLPAIQNNGRLTLQLPADLDPEKVAEDELKLLEAADPYQPRLKLIMSDKSLGSEAAWKIRLMGDVTDYNPMAKEQSNKVNYGMIVIKSLVWPGLTNVVHNKQWQQLYVGYGHKQSEKYFFPKEPQQIQLEAVDRDEQSEPNYPPEVADTDQQQV